LWELEEAQKRARKDGKRSHAEQEIFANILQQRRIVQEAASLSKQRRRQEKTPPDSAPSEATLDRPDTTKVVTSEIKPYPVEIWEGE
jgi:hypothetical protein